MARIVKLEAKGPTELKTEGDSKWVCACGLTDNGPLCDGSHKHTRTEEEGKIYKYDGQDREEINE